jgi:hypothetical protein
MDTVPLAPHVAGQVALFMGAAGSVVAMFLLPPRSAFFLLLLALVLALMAFPGYYRLTEVVLPARWTGAARGSVQAFRGRLREVGRVSRYRGVVPLQGLDRLHGIAAEVRPWDEWTTRIDLERRVGRLRRTYLARVALVLVPAVAVCVVLFAWQVQPSTPLSARFAGLTAVVLGSFVVGALLTTIQLLQIRNCCRIWLQAAESPQAKARTPVYQAADAPQARGLEGS